MDQAELIAAFRKIIIANELDNSLRRPFRQVRLVLRRQPVRLAE